MAEKIYTDINMKRSNGKNGEYVSITVQSLVTGVSQMTRTQSGKQVISCRIPISNRGKYIEKMCGLAPAEDSEGTAWARVSFWNNEEDRGLASRFEHLMEKNADKNVILTITGSIKVEDQNGRDGKTYRNVNIAADDFFVCRILDRKNNGGFAAASTPAPAAAAPAAAAPAPAAANGNFYEIDDDEDLPF